MTSLKPAVHKILPLHKGVVRDPNQNSGDLRLRENDQHNVFFIVMLYMYLYLVIIITIKDHLKKVHLVNKYPQGHCMQNIPMI